MQTLALHCVLARGLDPATAKKKVGSDEPVPVAAPRQHSPGPSPRFEIHVNEAHDPPKVYLFEKRQGGGALIRDTGIVQEIGDDPSHPGLKLLRICTAKLGQQSLLASLIAQSAIPD